MEENRGTNIENLPNEILQQIFQSLPAESRKRDRVSLLLVSKKFNALADESIGLEIYVGSSPWAGWEAASSTNHVDIGRIQDIGVSACHIGELMDLHPQPRGGLLSFVSGILGKVKSLFTSQGFPKFRHPHLLKTLRFSGIIQDEYFRGLLSAENGAFLRKLYLNHSSVSLVERSSLENINFPQLEYLEIMADFTYIFRDIDDSKILDNILALLENRYPRIRAAKVYLPFKPTRELDITRTFFNFMLMSSRKLRFVELCYFTMLLEDDEEDDVEEVDAAGVEEMDRLAQDAGASLVLKTIVLHISVEQLQYHRAWTKLLSQQSSIECFIVMSDIQIINRALIRQNARSLNTLLACINTRAEETGLSVPLDCDMFRDCIALTNVTIKGRYEDYSVMGAFPGIINPRLLPITIQHMDLSRIPILTEDLIEILNLPNLRYFVGKYIGKYGRMGATQAVVMQVIQRRQIHWFHLLGSINGLMPPNGITNGDPLHPVMLRAENESFCIKLGIHGYYVLASIMEEIVNHLNLISQRHIIE